MCIALGSCAEKLRRQRGGTPGLNKDMYGVIGGLNLDIRPFIGTHAVKIPETAKRGEI